MMTATHTKPADRLVTDTGVSVVSVTSGRQLDKAERSPRWANHCFECGRMFYSIRQTAMLCSTRCRKRWNRATKSGRAVKHANARYRRPAWQAWGGVTL